MSSVFVSYRRGDSAAMTGRIYDRLVQALGHDQVFKDVDKIPPGSDFHDAIDRAVAGCDVLLVIIGPAWLDAVDASGRRRLDDPDDFVRIEVEQGLARTDVRVIPTLVENAEMPTADDLPGSLQPLCRRQAVRVRNDPDFNRDVERLLGRLTGPGGVPRPAASSRDTPDRAGRRWLLGAGAGLLIAVAAGLVLLWPADSAVIGPDTVAKLREVRVMKHLGGVAALAFSNDGRLLASGGDDHRIRLWDVDSGAPVRVLDCHRSGVTSLDFSPDGRRLLSGDRKGEVHLSAVETGECLQRFDAQHGITLFVAISPDGRLGLSGGESWGALWDLEQGRQLRRLDEAAVVGGEFRPDLDSAVLSYNSDRLALWELSSGELLRQFDGGTEPGTGNADAVDVALAPDGVSVFGLWETGCVVRWNSNTGDKNSCWTQSGGYRLALSPDGSLMATAGRAAVSLTDLSNAAALRDLSAGGSRSSDVAFSPDGKVIAIGDADGSVRLWRVAN